jgi:hypothetical protein
MKYNLSICKAKISKCQNSRTVIKGTFIVVFLLSLSTELFSMPSTSRADGNLSCASGSFSSNTPDSDSLGKNIKDIHTYGRESTAVGMAILTNGNKVPSVLGGVSGAKIAHYQGRDSVALYVDNTAPPYLISTQVEHFNQRQAFFRDPLSNGQILSIKQGMFVVTSSSPPFTGTITSVDPGGKFISVDNWTAPGDSSSGQVPPSPSKLNFNPITGIWAINSGVFLKKGSVAATAQGYEMDLWNYLAVASGNNSMADRPRVIGFDLTTTGTKGASIGYSARGDIRDAFFSQTGWEAGYLYDPSLQHYPGAKLGGFVSRMDGGNAFNAIRENDGSSVFTVNGRTGSIVSAGSLTMKDSSSKYVRFSLNDGQLAVGTSLGNVLLLQDSGQKTTAAIILSSGNAKNLPSIQPSGGKNVGLSISGTGTGTVQLGNEKGNVVVVAPTQFLSWESHEASAEVVASGLTITSATLLDKTINQITYCKNGGVALPPSAPIGAEIVIFDRCGSAISVFPDTSNHQIEDEALGAPNIMKSAESHTFVRISPTKWLLY